MKTFGFCFLMTVLFYSSSVDASSISPIKKQMVDDLHFIRNVFEVKYAPLEWKKNHSGWKIEEQFEKAESEILNLKHPTTKDFQVILRKLFNSVGDYHVGVLFYSTEEAHLPFSIKSSGKRYFIVDVDRAELPYHVCPLSVGDEVILFNQRPIHEVVQEIKQREYCHSTEETDQALAEIGLTCRSGREGQIIPSGRVSLTVLTKGTRRKATYNLKWSYYPEQIGDFAKINEQNPLLYAAVAPIQSSPLKTTFSEFFNRKMIYPFWDAKSSFKSGNPCNIGSRESFLPPLGQRLWRNNPGDVFDAYIFSHPSGKRVGYIRIPHYCGDENEVYAFGELINFFNHTTDALVVDQLNNPGGSVFYLYGLASMLTDRPLYAPRHHLVLTQQEVETAVYMLSALEGIEDDISATEVIGDSIGGYPVDSTVAASMREFCHFVINEWNKGHLYTEPTPLFGIDVISPHPDVQYSKPILFLTNALDFSCGDFMPAILQDNQRATIMGTRTAGAGGFVFGTQFPNRSGIMGFSLTGSLAERINHEPIENLGVKPDVFYNLSVCDLTENYKEFVEAIVERLGKIIE